MIVSGATETVINIPRFSWVRNLISQLLVSNIDRLQFMAQVATGDAIRDIWKD